MKKLTYEELKKYRIEAKEKIQLLINEEKIDEAEVIVKEYEKIVRNDIEIYSIKAVIYIKRNELENAEKVILEGLKKEKNNFDLLYNLAFINELRNEYKNAINIYKNAKRYIIGNYNMKEEINCIISNLLTKIEDDKKNKITILIPTRNRIDYVKRCVSHFYSMNDEKLIVYIILLDGSDEEIKVKNKEFIDCFDENLVTHMSYDTSSWPFDRVNDIIRDVKTDFCCICADDDFFEKSGIISAISLLKGNIELGAVVGEMLRFNEGNLKDFYKGQGFDFKSILENDPIERLYNFFGKNELLQLIYLVYRTESLIEVLDNIPFKSINGTFQEILWYFNVVVSKKLGKIDEILIVREIANNDNTIKYMKSNFYDLMINGTFNNQYLNLKKALLKFLEKKLNGEIKSSDINNNIDNIFTLYLKRWGIKDEYIFMKNSEYNLPLLKEGMDILGWDKI